MGKDAAAYILADEEDAFVRAHFLGDSFLNGVDQSQGFHRALIREHGAKEFFDGRACDGAVISEGFCLRNFGFRIFVQLIDLGLGQFAVCEHAFCCQPYGFSP